MDLTRLRHIVAVARNQSFSRAADEEGITQPALSRSIAAFEQRYGVVLFDRGRGGARPTAAGQLVIDQARQLITAAADLERSLKRYPHGGAGRISIGFGPLVAGLLLPKLVGTLLNSHPGLQLFTMIRPPAELIADLLSDKIEMILGNNWNLGRVPGTELERLGQFRIAFMVRAGHPLTRAACLCAADLEDYPTANAVELSTGGATSHAGSVICDNYHLLRETALHSDCVWLSSPIFLADDLREGRIVQLDVQDMPPSRSDIYLVSKRGRARSTAAIAATEAIRTLLHAIPFDQ